MRAAAQAAARSGRAQGWARSEPTQRLRSVPASMVSNVITEHFIAHISLESFTSATYHSVHQHMLIKA